jgi:hypothetical protein
MGKSESFPRQHARPTFPLSQQNRLKRGSNAAHLEQTIFLVTLSPGIWYSLGERDTSSVSQLAEVLFKQWRTDVGETGKKDKGRKEVQKKPALTLKEKRKVKNEKKGK